MEIKVDNGKYTFILPNDDYRVHVLRYGEPWLIIEQGCNAIHALMYVLEEEKEKVAILSVRVALPTIF